MHRSTLHRVRINVLRPASVVALGVAVPMTAQQVQCSILHRVGISVLRPPSVVALGVAVPVTAGIVSVQHKFWNSKCATAGLPSSRRRQQQVRS